MTALKVRRGSLGAAAIFSVNQAAELLPWRDADAVAWLREHRLVRRTWLGGESREVVIWGDVVEAFRSAPEDAQGAPEAPEPHGTVSRPMPRFRLARSGG